MTSRESIQAMDVDHAAEPGDLVDDAGCTSLFG
jgi:hypothetical protein